MDLRRRAHTWPRICSASCHRKGGAVPFVGLPPQIVAPTVCRPPPSTASGTTAILGPSCVWPEAVFVHPRGLHRSPPTFPATSQNNFRSPSSTIWGPRFSGTLVQTGTPRGRSASGSRERSTPIPQCFVAGVPSAACGNSVSIASRSRSLRRDGLAEHVGQRDHRVIKR